MLRCLLICFEVCLAFVVVMVKPFEIWLLTLASRRIEWSWMGSLNWICILTGGRMKVSAKNPFVGELLEVGFR